jgi:type IV pilus biogenesis protein PilP
MRAISWIVACAAFVTSGGAFAEPPTPAMGEEAPKSIANPPGPPNLAPLSPDFQAAMASSQLQTYRYNQLTEQALALKKLCETGFGPADICRKGTGSAGEGMTGSAPADLPVVIGIDGAAGALSAVLVFADGRRLTVRPGSALPGGATVRAISADGVHVREASGAETVLPFGDRGPAR